MDKAAARLGGRQDYAQCPLRPFGLDFGTLDFGTLDSGLTIFSYFTQDNDAKWPTEFNGNSFKLLERQTNEWCWITIYVDEVKQRYHDVLKNKKLEYVLVYTPQGERTPHAIYVDEYDSSKKIVTCINSYGPFNPRPQVDIKDISHLYQVNCSMDEASQNGNGNGKNYKIQIS